MDISLLEVSKGLEWSRSWALNIVEECYIYVIQGGALEIAESSLKAKNVALPRETDDDQNPLLKYGILGLFYVSPTSPFPQEKYSFLQARITECSQTFREEL